MRTAKCPKCGTAEFVILDKTATVAVRTAGAIAGAAAGSFASRVIDKMRSTYKCNKCGKIIDG